MSAADKRQKVADIINKVWTSLSEDLEIISFKPIVVDNIDKGTTTVVLSCEIASSLLAEEQREKRLYPS